MTPTGIQPVTFQFVAQHLNHCATMVPQCVCMYVCMYVNKVVIILQVAVQATPCVDWELHAPANGALNCLPGEKGLQCIATCSPGYR